MTYSGTPFFWRMSYFSAGRYSQHILSPDNRSEASLRSLSCHMSKSGSIADFIKFSRRKRITGGCIPNERHAASEHYAIQLLVSSIQSNSLSIACETSLLIFELLDIKRLGIIFICTPPKSSQDIIWSNFYCLDWHTLMLLVQVKFRGALCITVIVLGNEIGDLSSNPELACMFCVNASRKGIDLSVLLLTMCKIVREIGFLSLG